MGMVVVEAEEPTGALFLEPVLPASAEEALEENDAIKQAIRDCEELGGDDVVRILKDDILLERVIEVFGSNVRVLLPTRSVLRTLVLQIRNLDLYFSFEVEILDKTKTYRVLHVSNNASVVRVQPAQCFLPMQLTSDWNYLTLELEDLVQKVFGTEYLSTVQVRVQGNCRIRRIFFQDENYSDAELPDFLRLNEEYEDEEEEDDS